MINKNLFDYNINIILIKTKAAINIININIYIKKRPRYLLVINWNANISCI